MKKNQEQNYFSAHTIVEREEISIDNGKVEASYHSEMYYG